jgi:hypothetical protein
MAKDDLGKLSFEMSVGVLGKRVLAMEAIGKD